MTENFAWPELDYRLWAPTKKTLQMCAQMLGKVRLSLAPPQPEWLNACLYLDPRGLTTGPMPCGERLVTLCIDLSAGRIEATASDGRSAAIPIADRCVADIWQELNDALGSLDVVVDVWDKPQELADVTPFSQNRHDCVFVPEQALRFHRLLCTLQGVFEEFRATFFGRSGVQFWWGAFDLSVLLFSGEHLTAPDDQGYIMRYDLDAQHFNAGFWPGDDASPYPGFYGYLVPRPPGCETAPIAPEPAGWVEAMGEWLLPYDRVRENVDPRRMVLDFLESVYQAALDLGGWDAQAYRYRLPKSSARGVMR